uniref:hypothetical protein n=1 Tax=Cephaloticoccus sp. TaxID=1985742 RepID=UPI00404963FF
MPLPLRRARALLFFFLAFGWIAQVNGQVTLTSSPLSTGEAQKITVTPSLELLPELTGDATGLTPRSWLTRDKSLWLLSEAPDRSQVWLKHNKEGWKRVSNPPARISNIQPGGQAHVLALGVDDRGVATFYT